MIEPTCEKIFKLRDENKLVNHIRCDNGGENQGLENCLQSVDWKSSIKFEFTGSFTPQRNHLSEVDLATIGAKRRAIMSAVGIPKELRQTFWRETFQTSTYLDGLVLVEIGGVLKLDSSIGKENSQVLFNI